jgi:cell fate (sporulation/competence/biofilm development) regulator YlbF (YheA/YmcA/DUF963 family)
MSTKTLTIRSVTRTTNDGAEETLTFRPGVNVLVGRPNTGKTKWLTMLDFLTGSDDSAASAMGSDISEKYASILGVIEIGGEQHVLERRWKETGFKTRVLLDGEAIAADEFSSVFLQELGIPVLRFPHGNLYSPSKWPELSWKSLYRHIYRRQRFWADIADRQPPGDQHACILQFLGAAELLYSAEYEEYVNLNKQVYRLQAAKDQFNEILSELYRYIVEDEGVSVDPTPESVDGLIERLNQAIQETSERRAILIGEIMGQARAPSAQPDIERLSESWERLQIERSENEAHLSEAEQRLAQLIGYRREIEAELGRLSRTRDAVDVLADLQATHCPVCDQEVSQTNNEDGTCFMCHQPWNDRAVPSPAREQRIQFEEHQLRAEQEEVDGLVETVSTDRDARRETQHQLDVALRQIDSEMQPIRQATATILPPELARLDVEMGNLQERSRIVARLRSMLDQREERSQQIDNLSSEIKRLGARIDELGQGLNLESRAGVLADGMNSYLNALNLEYPDTWTLDRVTVLLRERNFSIRIGNEPWSDKAGGTLTHYFLLAYHYALMSLSNRVPYHYPGLAIIDFPAPIENTVTIADKENFVLNPFVSLLGREEMANTQVIAAGAAFAGLEHAHRIELKTVWT